MSRQIFANKTTFTSDPITLDTNARGYFSADLAIRGTIGAGSVAIEVKSSDGSFYSYPDLTFDANTFGTLEFSTSVIRVVCTNCTDVTVEV